MKSVVTVLTALWVVVLVLLGWRSHQDRKEYERRYAEYHAKWTVIEGGDPR